MGLGGERGRGFGWRQAGWLATLAAGILLATAPRADAAVSCAFNDGPPGVMDVNMSADDDGVTFYVSGGDIRLDVVGGTTNVSCTDGTTESTVSNVDEIEVHDGSPADADVTILSPADFVAPGSPLNPDEVKFDLDYAAGTTIDALTLYGAPGNDQFRAGASGIDFNAGSETVAFDADITLSGVAPILTTILQTGDDFFTGQGVDLLGDTPITYNTHLEGGAGDDIIIGGSGQDPIEGGPDDDTLDGRGGTPGTLDADDGDDILESGSGTSNLVGDVGSDTVRYASASGPVTASVDAVGVQATGGGGSDTYSGIENITGSPYSDALTGDENNNALDGAGQTAGAGDTVHYSNAAAGVNVSLRGDGSHHTGSAGIDTLTDLESLVGSPFDDTLEGNSGNNTLNGFGATTADTVTYIGGGSVTVNLSLTGPQDTGGEGTDTLTGFRNLTGSGFDDSLAGDLTLNRIDGESGDDDLDGGAGGNDDLDGGAGSDTVSFASCGDLTCDGVRADLDAGIAQDTIGTPLGVFTSIENLTGSVYADQLNGDAGRNALRGGDGDDLVRGGTGKDDLRGENGVDKLKAKDGRKDVKIHCGPGANGQESAKFDKDKDPKPKSC
jgi:Ca2+-binding RTX toxin-like protein